MQKSKPFKDEADCETRIHDYFEEHLPQTGEVADIESLADYLNITREELIELMSDKRYGRALRLARNRIAKLKKQLAFCGKLPAAVLAFDLKNNHGYRDKPEECESGSETVVFKGLASDWAK
ncbi:MAG: hypothetical protein IKK70_01770 [Clostridia bacterium]|nr:hypothetical protein [Clostridia bacterium]